MAVVRWLLILSVLFVLIVFGVYNMESVVLTFKFPSVFFTQLEMPLFLVVVASIFGGAALAGMIGLGDHLRLHGRLRRQRKNIEKLEGEVKSLRNLPLEEETIET